MFAAKLKTFKVGNVQEDANEKFKVWKMFSLQKNGKSLTIQLTRDKHTTKAWEIIDEGAKVMRSHF